MTAIEILPHPLLDAGVFVSRLPAPLGEIETQAAVLDLFRVDVDGPLRSSDEVRLAVRDLLRHGGFKPTGRSKPAAEYLIKAAANDKLGPINLAVDVCNAVSLHSGLPISVVDLDLVTPPLRLDVAAADAEYIFNQSGQTIDLGGLLCLFDAKGPCANAVKDSQRTKTHPGTTSTLTVIWGSNELAGRTSETQRWYHELLQQHGVTIETQSPGR